MENLLDKEISKGLVKDLIVCSRYLRHYRHKYMAQDRIIELLGNNGFEMSQKELQNRLGIRAGSISELISKLKNRGFVIQTRSDEDKRAFNVLLTDQGKEYFEERSWLDDDYETLFTALSDEEKYHLHAILEKLGNDWLNKDPAIMEYHGHGARITKGEHGDFDVDLSQQL